MEALTTEFRSGSPSVLRVSGEIDVATAEQLRGALDMALSTDPKVVVDMADLEFIDGAGLRILLQTAASLDGAGPLTLVHAPLVARLLKLVGDTGLPTIEILE